MLTRALGDSRRKVSRRARVPKSRETEVDKMKGNLPFVLDIPVDNRIEQGGLILGTVPILARPRFLQPSGCFFLRA